MNTRSSSVFKEPINIDTFYSFLNENYDVNKNNNTFIISRVSYNKLVYYNKINIFISSIRNNYKESRRHYLDGKMSYNRFNTIFRQICTNLGIEYSHKLIYYNSKYEIEYYIKCSNTNTIVSEVLYDHIGSL